LVFVLALDWASCETGKKQFQKPMAHWRFCHCLRARNLQVASKFSQQHRLANLPASITGNEISWLSQSAVM
jgi:hypothetical protein